MRTALVAILASGAAVAAIAISAIVTGDDDSGAPGPTTRHSPARRAPASDSYSNIFAADYAGPDACADCHADKHAHWDSSLHRSMNRVAGPDTVRGEPGAPALEYAGGAVEFSRDGDGYTMRLLRSGEVVRAFRVTRTIGVHSLQEYVGIQARGPEPAGDPIYEREIRLPFGYWIDRGQWFPQQYFDSWFEAEYDEAGALAGDPYAPDTSAWAQRCPWCHNTYPFSLRAIRAHGDEPRGFGPEQYVALTSELDPERTRAVVDDNQLPVDELVTVGISCESCHFGGRRHVENGEPMIFWPRSPQLREVRDELPRGGRTSNHVINAICAQCHSAPSPQFPDGSAVRNSREALDLISGACASKIACIDCHDPHVRRSGRAAPDRVCGRCHDDLAAPQATAAHSHHGAGVGCADCHMPRIVQGITDVVRSHHISSPGDGGMMGPSWPNACNLCHVDKSTQWTVEQLATLWHVEIVSDSSSEPAGRAWLAADSRDTRLLAMDALARSGRAGLPALLSALDQTVAYDRMRAVIAVERAIGRKLSNAEYDPQAPPARRAQQVPALADALLGR